ncbi:hypothetical protein RRG08_002827 [Elysia crispata]|uniref:Uncharacterized protein n=1 Tax=Elysia crispata TaxID=231223 RepID=A0AAE1CM41_9GAST|nr:hypothetical protein RRG08_002827 [Elysia crispata]
MLSVEENPCDTRRPCYTRTPWSQQIQLSDHDVTPRDIFRLQTLHVSVVLIFSEFDALLCTLKNLLHRQISVNRSRKEVIDGFFRYSKPEFRRELNKTMAANTSPRPEGERILCDMEWRTGQWPARASRHAGRGQPPSSILRITDQFSRE